MTFVPPSAGSDARNRAWRTFWTGLGVDVAAAVGMALVAALPGVQWTRAYWIGLGTLVASTALKSVASYFARVFIPPNI